MTARRATAGGFVGILRGPFERHVEERGYSPGAANLLLRVLVLADHRTGAIVDITKQALAEHLGYRQARTLDKPLAELVVGGTISCTWVLGHDGRIEVLAWDELVHSPVPAGGAQPRQTRERNRVDRSSATAPDALATRASVSPTRVRDETTTTKTGGGGRGEEQATDEQRRSDLVDRAIDHIVDDEEAAERPGRIENPGAWRRTVAARIRREQGAHLEALAAVVPVEADPDEAARGLAGEVREREPRLQQRVLNLAGLAAAPATCPLDLCAGVGLILDDDGHARPCPHKVDMPPVSEPSAVGQAL